MHCEGSVRHGRVLLPKTIQRKNPSCPFLRPIKRSLHSLQNVGCIPCIDPLGALHEIKYFSFHFYCPILWGTEHGWEAKCEVSGLDKGSTLSPNCRASFPQTEQRHLLLV